MITCKKKMLIVSIAVFFLTGLTSVQAGADNHKDPYEHMLYRRAVETAVWAMPMVSLRGFIKATRRDLGGDWNDLVYFSRPMTSRHRFLTANNQTPYVVACFNTRNGPLVVELPGASAKVKLFGSFVDAWDYPFTDVGPKGADKGKGGKYLFLPPGYDGPVPETGYLVFRPRTYAVYAALRPVPVKGATYDDVVAYDKTIKVYPLGKADNPPPVKFIDAYPKKWDTLPKYDLSYFQDIADVVQEEPVQARDLAMMGQLAAIGIEKGKPFNPDEKMKKILKGAIQEAYEYLQWLFINRAFRTFFEGTHWSAFNLSREQAMAGWPFVTEDRMLIDQRATLYHFATFMPKVLGKGAFYLVTLYDAQGKPLDGKSVYRLRVPADAPVRDFWSIIAYSFTNYSFIEGSQRVGISSFEKNSLKMNADGSVDLYFAPKAPEGFKANWIPTGERFWIAMRLFGPQKALFQKTWKIQDVVKVK